ncbi:competence protein ComFA [Paenibacillus sp. V4I3]|uniref:DEAD/DEAH box helicase n=1 Tax=Paenibacillus sp. V4I3 TaxID=3042305 RepID=UPI00278A5985|nr:helicase-related protein [Paenibacillus sp. V4I3]MDQ0872156.1 competence protein ComFA [Paenibacillus sp. V4I3]
MKVQLYAVSLGKEWEWRLTIHSQTDIQYWFEHYAADAGLVLFEPFISLGQGVRMLQRLNADERLAFVSHDERVLERLRQLIYEYNMPIGEDLRMQKMKYEVWKQGKYPSNTLDAHVYAIIVEVCSGRSLLVEEFQQLLVSIGVDLGTGDAWLSYLQLAHLNGDVEVRNGLEVIERRDWRRGFRKMTSYTCKRCGSGAERMFWSDCLHCGQACPYCEECLTMGRARFCSLLVIGRSGEVAPYRVNSTGSWVGQGGVEVRKGEEQQEQLRAYIEPWGLSEAQASASLEGLRYISGNGVEGSREKRAGYGRVVWPGSRARRGRERAGADAEVKAKVNHQFPRRFLIWAVTGAGKTEMIFPFIHHTIARGGRVLIATPRKDVVLELQPRIGRAFADYSVVTLYGGSEQRWEQGQITIATTHQLLRFHEAFDLVIIDEIDAFPYHNNPMLAYAAAKVCKPSGTNILLSATPPRAVRQAAKRGRLPHVRVPVRFHRHPLPVPQLVSAPPLRRVVQSQTMPKPLFTQLAASVERGAQVFVFVPNIQLVEPMVNLLRVKLSHEKSEAIVCVEGTSSKDLARTEKVQLFRNREIRVLVTTTILERGVTVPKSDVFILDADSQLFDEAALVQMAGRAGRSKEDPAGKVYFAAKEITQSQKEAIQQIKQMNRIARKQGYLLRGK